jgi:MoaA/NifB/PqqE/SkfB family radical SAM enzyme
MLDTYPRVDMKLDQVKQIFDANFVRRLRKLLINGNYGDFVTAQDGLEIVRYFKQINPLLDITISTNASARPKIWQELGKLKIKVWFRLDGLEDTHSLYRIGTDYDTVLENAQSFISAGGHAIWAMIKFDHNEHQIDQCRQLSKQLKFKEFLLIDVGRNTMPVFTLDRRLSHIIGDYRGSTNFSELFDHSSHYLVEPWQIVKQETANWPISCHAEREKEIYVAANGEVYPCCWLGFYPGYSDRHSSNPQLKLIMKNNNALEHGLEESIKWFSNVKDSWALTVPEGKIFACNHTCGRKNDVA